MGFGGWSAHGGFDRGKSTRARLREKYGKQKRTVYTTSMVAHVWAHTSGAYGSNAKGTLYFDGPTLYSYGEHYPLAHMLTGREGQWAALFNCARSTVTTRRHWNLAWCAVEGCNINRFAVPVVVPRSKADHLTNLAYLGKLVADEIERSKNPRTHEPATEEVIVSLRGEAISYARFFGCLTAGRKLIPAMPQRDIIAAWEARANEFQRKRFESRRKRYEREQAQKIREMARLVSLMPAAIEAWRQRLPTQGINPSSFPTTIMRVNADRQVIETSQGADFPIEHAKRAWPIIARLYARGGTYQRNGKSIPLGHFVIDRIEEDGTVVAGCHRVLRAEVERLASELGLPPVKASHGKVVALESENGSEGNEQAT